MNVNKLPNESALTLSNQTLAQVPSFVDTPNYDRSAVEAGIVHIGVGGFHRAHQAVYCNELLKLANNNQWGICGIGLFEANRHLSQVLNQQDGLYTLLVRHPDGKVEHQIIGSLVEFILAPGNKQQAIDKLAAAQTKIISLTITEGGYNVNPADGTFNFENPDVQHDLAHPADPVTAFGYLAAGLKRRRDNNLPGVTILSCDNVQHNGDVAKKMLLSFIQKLDAELAQWVTEHVTFPNSMVDRITPQTTGEDIQYVEQLGVADEWPITCEPFMQWVIEDKFAQGRPNWDLVGAQFVDNVSPYEKMKLRLLNAGHSVLGILGALEGFATINDCVADATFSQFLLAYLDKEATATLEPVPGIDLTEYKKTVLARFANPNIQDSVGRICSESSAKIPKFILEAAVENSQNKQNVTLAALVIAAWCYTCDKQVDKLGNKINIQDEMTAQLTLAARGTNADVLSFLKLTSVFGDIVKNDHFVNAYIQAVHDVYTAKASVKALMQNQLNHME
ncbi:D-mannonate oxidoreductase [Catenovulum agarivorans DS-2]|uniref:D-mannonate oxidoreductase n=1 Tax=Catenovulum agarivorans DS-2 TaxID=1328313 RepID=W7Q779_9ALTE|nr:mannitol dehydrogenase family protein [Catenovulum agarivorans]EWH08624.1 D-mannonate oxidoreductase [Catenovulum agarivorans DS-2]